MWQRNRTGFSVGAPAARKRTTRFCLRGSGPRMHVFRREAGITEALLHGRGTGGDIALRRVCSVDLDELLEDGACFGAVASDVAGKGL